MSSSDNTPKDLGSTTSPLFLEKVKEVLSVLLGNRGDGNSRALTLRDLQDSGVIGSSVAAKVQAAAASLSSGSSNTTTIINTSSTTTIDLTAPPTPTNFTATGAISNLIVECDTQTYTAGNGHYRSALYGVTWTSGTLPVFANAVLLTEFAGKVFSYATNPSITWHLWLKWQTKDGVYSVNPAGGTNGVVVTTGADVSLMVAAMTGAGNPFTILTASTVINGVTFPAGTYSTNAFIQDAQITTAKIKNLAVDDAKINALSVSKLTAGTVSAQDMISTGQTVVNSVSEPSWSINGATGLATFNNVTIRGTVYASSGSFTGAVYASSGSFTGTVFASSGSFTGAVNATSGSFTGSILATSIGTSSGKFYVNNQGILTATEGFFSGQVSAGSVDFGSSVGTTVVYSVPSTYIVTVPALMTRMRVTLKGSGGGGAAGSSGYHGRGGGGKSGSIVATLINVSPGQQFSLVIYPGGAGGHPTFTPGLQPSPASGNRGIAGQATVLHGYLSAPGGIQGELLENDIPPVSPDYGVAANFCFAGQNGFGTNGGLGAATYFVHGSAGTNGSGGGGGAGTGAIYNVQAQGTSGGAGGAGSAIFEFFDPNGVVLKGPFDFLKAELRTQGLTVT